MRSESPLCFTTRCVRHVGRKFRMWNNKYNLNKQTLGYPSTYTRKLRKAFVRWVWLFFLVSPFRSWWIRSPKIYLVSFPLLFLPSPQWLLTCQSRHSPCLSSDIVGLAFWGTSPPSFPFHSERLFGIVMNGLRLHADWFFIDEYFCHPATVEADDRATETADSHVFLYGGE